MNTTELKALAEDLQINHEYCPKEVIQKASSAILELITNLEDAQGEIRALRATEAGLRDQLAAVEADRAQRVPEDAISGALFDFAGFLTTLDVPVRFGSTEEASPMVELLQGFAKKRGLSLDDADVLHWSTLLASTPAPAQQPKPSPIKAEHTTVYPSGTTVTRLELTDEAKESLRADVPHIPGQPVERKPMTDEQAVKCIEAAGFKTWTSAHFRLVKEAENHHGIKE